MSALSYAHGASDVPLLGDTIGERLRATVERFGDREALVVRHQGYRATYRELWEESGRAARGLLARGVERGDRVGIWAPNRAEWVVSQYATARVGADPRQRQPGLQAQRARVRADALRDRSPAARARLPRRGLRRRCSTTCAPAARRSRRRSCSTTAGTRCSPTATTCPRRCCATREAALQFDDPINIQYTSGTTGFPKGATLSHHNILNNGHFIAGTLRYTEDDRVCVPVPFYHCFGMVHRQPRLHDARRLRRRPRRVVRSARRARGRRGRALHVALRRADDVRRRARAPALRATSTCPACAPA